MEDNTRNQPKQAQKNQTHLLASDDLLSPLLSVSAHGWSKKTYTVYGFLPLEQQTVRLGFTGECLDLPTGHYALGNGHRFFNPVLMRFNSPDRLSPFDAGGTNGYCYCQGDPINYSDPSGRFGQTKVAKPPPLQTSKSWGSQLWTSVRQSLTRGPQSPSTYSAPRRDIQQNVPEDSLFGRSVQGVNANLGSHGNNSLPQQKAEQYRTLAQSDLSNSSRFASSAQGWLTSAIEQLSPNKLVGAVFNFGGMLGAGVHDQGSYKTGAILRHSGSTGTTAGTLPSIEEVRKTTN